MRALLIGPAADVIQRARVTQAVSDQRADHLAMGQLSAPTRRQRAIDRLSQPKPLQVAGDQRERPAPLTGALRRRVKPRKRRRKAVQLARGLQLLPPTQVCHDTLAHPTVLIAIALHQLHVHIAVLAPRDGRFFEEHVAITIRRLSDRNHRHSRPKSCHNNPAPTKPPTCRENSPHTFLKRGRRV